MVLMLNKILIANRGEIACRVIKTARRMGIATVAVYSDADADAAHVEMADEAVHIGPPPVAQSYLQGARIIEVALKTGAGAIHPGYGFLSENPEFVEAVTAASLRFIGPPADAIRAMGLKDAAKALMEQSGVPVVPGYHGTSQDPAFLAEQAVTIGYPVLIKARAGGGGKGMRKVDDPKDFDAALQAARREGEASFGDPACLIEKWITTPRHIEVQVFGDDHGNVVHLFERDCSLQRRHQKVIEEAPAPGMTSQMRDAMGQAAVRAAKAVNYSGAGTVEFIVDATDGLKTDGFYFMEMNTRLQVEHPVTEAISGLDLVEWQLRVASGEPLPLRQDDLTLKGWAFEARLYAEDVEAGFLPATGRLTHVDLPETIARIDSGVRTGDVISPHYDPMIAKIICEGPDRESALTALNQALRQARIAGVTTNVTFLHALTEHEGFRRGEVDTGLIERDLSDLTAHDDDPFEPGLAALATLGFLDRARDPELGWTLWKPLAQSVRLFEHETEQTLRIEIPQPGKFKVIGDETLELDVLDVTGTKITFVAGGIRRAVHVSRTRDEVTVFGTRVRRFTIPDPLDAGMGDTGDAIIRAPMPGLVKLVHVQQDQTVSEGDPLLVLEAMKMEHVLKAATEGRVISLSVGEGDQVEAGAILAEVEPNDG